MADVPLVRDGILTRTSALVDGAAMSSRRIRAAMRRRAAPNGPNFWRDDEAT